MNVVTEEDLDDSDVSSIEVRELRHLGQFLGPYFSRYRRLGLGLAIVLLLETGFNCCFPLATRYLIDDGLIKRDQRGDRDTDFLGGGRYCGGAFGLALRLSGRGSPRVWSRISA